MRIAFVYDTVYPDTKGGVEKRVWELARRLVGRGHEVHLLVPRGWEGPSRIERDGVVLRGVCRNRPLYTRRGRRAVLPALAYALGAARLLRGERFDLVDCQIPAHPAAVGAWLVARRRSHSKLVITWHEAWDRAWVEEMGFLGHVGKWVEALVVRLPATHMAVSRHTADTLAYLGRQADAIILAGVDVPSKARPVEAPSSDILFVGRLVPTKNVGLLIEAVAALVARGIRPRVLVIGDGPSRTTWEGQVDRQGLSERIEFAGDLESSEQVMAAMESTRLLALPSIREGFGLVALEAAALGVPVVTVDHPRNAARHLVVDDVTGLCVPPTTGAFADALQAILVDDHLRDRLGAEAERRALEVTWDSTVDDTEAIYRIGVA